MFTFISNIPEFMFFPHTIIYFRSLFIKHCCSIGSLFCQFLERKSKTINIYARAHTCVCICACDIIRRSFLKRTVVPSVFIFRLHIVYFMFIDIARTMWYTYRVAREQGKTQAPERMKSGNTDMLDRSIIDNITVRYFTT